MRCQIHGCRQTATEAMVNLPPPLPPTLDICADHKESITAQMVALMMADPEVRALLGLNKAQ